MIRWYDKMIWQDDMTKLYDKMIGYDVWYDDDIRTSTIFRRVVDVDGVRWWWFYMVL